MRQLQLYMDENSVMKCRGRMKNAPMQESAKYPILLPPNELLTTLIVKEAHEQLLHSGVNSTITHVRQTIWIPSIRQFVETLIRKCVTCRKVNGPSYQAPDPSPLPKLRVQEASPPFTVTGRD